MAPCRVALQRLFRWRVAPLVRVVLSAVVWLGAQLSKLVRPPPGARVVPPQVLAVLCGVGKGRVRVVYAVVAGLVPRRLHHA